MHQTYKFTLAALLAFCAAGASAQDQAASDQPAPDHATTRTTATASAATAVDDATKQSVRSHLEQARTTFVGGNQPDAALHVNKAVTLLRTEAGREQNDAGDDLRAAIERLEKLAGKLERSEVKNTDDFKDAYGDVYERLAWHHYERAERMYADRYGKQQPATDVSAMSPEGIRNRNAQRSADQQTREARMERQDEQTERLREQRQDAAGEAREQAQDAREDARDAARRADHETTESWTERMRFHMRESTENFGAWAHETGTEVRENTGGAGTTLKNWTGKAISGTGNVTENIGETLNKWGEELRQYGRGVQRNAKHDARATTGTDRRTTDTE